MRLLLGFAFGSAPLVKNEIDSRCCPAVESNTSMIITISSFLDPPLDSAIDFPMMIPEDAR